MARVAHPPQPLLPEAGRRGKKATRRDKQRTCAPGPATTSTQSSFADPHQPLLLWRAGGARKERLLTNYGLLSSIHPPPVGELGRAHPLPPLPPARARGRSKWERLRFPSAPALLSPAAAQRGEDRAPQFLLRPSFPHGKEGLGRMGTLRFPKESPPHRLRGGGRGVGLAFLSAPALRSRAGDDKKERRRFSSAQGIKRRGAGSRH